MLTQIIRYLNIIVFLGICHSSTLYTFASEQQEQHYYNYISHVRCLVCQNESIKDSNAPLANQLRTIIYEKMINGQSDEHINQFLNERYGEFVNYKPEFNLLTSFLWIIPIIVFLGLIFRFFEKNNQP